MKYPVTDIVERVRVALDENEVQVALIAEDSNTLTLDEIIRHKIVDAARYVCDVAPVGMMHDAPSLPTSSIVWGSGGGGSIALPADFLRLVAFKMRGWTRAVTQAIDEHDPLYPPQKSKYPGVGGNSDNPVVAVVFTNSGRVLEFYSCDTTPEVVEVAKYLRLPQINADPDSIEICQQLLDALVYRAGGLTAMTIKDDNAKALLDIADRLITQN